MGRTKKNIIISTIENNITDTNIIDTNIIDTNIIDISKFKKKEKMLYDVVNDFFNKCSKEEINKIISIINGKYKISLRFLDWFVTRYCYLYKTSIPINNNYNKEQDFNINISYKAQLKSFKKKCFDPFKRKNKFYHSFDLQLKDTYSSSTILTTLGQLNFFKWALSFDVINYVENNFDKINSKILHVNSFFKKNIIDNNTLSLISSDELKSKISNINSNSNSNSNLNSNSNSNSNIDSDNSINQIKLKKKLNIENNSSLEIKKQVYSYPIVARNIFVEL
jgi:hypothetical protein